MTKKDKEKEEEKRKMTERVGLLATSTTKGSTKTAKPWPRAAIAVLLLQSQRSGWTKEGGATYRRPSGNPFAHPASGVQGHLKMSDEQCASHHPSHRCSEFLVS